MSADLKPEIREQDKSQDEVPFIRTSQLKPFSQGRITHEVIIERSRTTGIDPFLVFTASSGFTVYIPNSVVQRAMAIAERASPREFIGLCAGHVFQDHAGQYVIIQGIVPDTSAEASPGRVQTTSDSEYATRKLLAVLYPDCLPLGWCHSHLGIGAFFSAVDQKNQATWRQPYHLGIVVDPMRRELAIFRGPEAEKVEHVRLEEDAALECFKLSDTNRRPIPARAEAGKMARLLHSPFIFLILLLLQTLLLFALLMK